MSEFPIRPGAVTDRSFIFDSWRHSFWDAPAVRGMGRDQYFADMGRRVEALLDRTAVLVAHDPADPDIILAWACIEPPAVHYVFVRKDFRGLGLARALVSSIEGLTTFTHWSRGLRSAPASLQYRPFYPGATP